MPRRNTTQPSRSAAERAAQGGLPHASRPVSRIIVLGAAIVLLALVLVACGRPAVSDRASNGTADSTGPEATGTPQVEDTGPQSARPTGENRPAIDMASLPVGGGAEDSSARHQCIGVSWLGSDIPAGFAVVVTSVRIEPGDAFAVSSSGCDEPRCGSSFAFEHKGDTCIVPVDATGSPNEDARLYVDGRLRCPQGQRAQCESFAAHEEERSIGLTVPDQQEPATQPPSTGPTTQPTSVEPSSSQS